MRTEELKNACSKCHTKLHDVWNLQATKKGLTFIIIKIHQRIQHKQFLKHKALLPPPKKKKRTIQRAVPAKGRLIPGAPAHGFAAKSAVAADDATASGRPK